MLSVFWKPLTSALMVTAFVTMMMMAVEYLSVLIASSIVKDGHGMLPLLAESRRDFLLLKEINLVLGLGVGSLLLALDL